ncbi:MAG: c-type cytochrome biogenesis protein CcsB [Hyphomicrobiales bacterium]
MEAALIVSILLYLLSAAGYLAYFFLQKKHLQQAGFIVLVGGFIFHSAALVLDYHQQGHIPVTNMRETLSLAGWAIAGVFILLNYRYNLKILGVYAAPFVALIMVIVSQLPEEPLKTTQLFKSVWLVAHVTVIFIGEAAFALACGAGILYLIQEGSIKTKKRRFFFKRLPSLDLLDSTGYGCIVVGFTMLTIGLITGLVYAKSVWGRFWSWDPKEVWSGLAWLFYAALLHERLAVGWRGRRSAIMAIVGFGVLVFTFLGVNLFMEGHHREFTK